MSRVKTGDTLNCEVCGLTVIVDEECGCAVTEIICCEEPMMNKGPVAPKKKEVAVAAPKKKTAAGSQKESSQAGGEKESDCQTGGQKESCQESGKKIIDH